MDCTEHVKTPHFELCDYTQRNHFEILINQTEIRFYLPFSDWFGTKRTLIDLRKLNPIPCWPKDNDQTVIKHSYYKQGMILHHKISINNGEICP